MLPRATLERTPRERGGPGGRTQEIQRLIGRSLRAALSTLAFVALYPDKFVEIQCTGEGSAFNRAGLDRLLALAHGGITELFAAQRRALGW